MIVAPAGFGKTSLLAEWQGLDERRWIWLEPGDVSTGVENARPTVVVIDDAQRWGAGTLTAQVEHLLDALPRGSLIVLAARSEPALPVGRLRAHGQLLEVRRADLRLTLGEGDLLLRRSGAECDVDAVEVLIRRTDGWAAAMALAVSGRRAGPDGRPQGIPRLRGDDHAFAEYVREEVLCALSADQRVWLRRCAILDELSGPLCDAVLGGRDSAEELRLIARVTQLLDPVDVAHRGYRWHTLLRECMLGELRRLEPELEPELHRRASLWERVHGDADAAIAHACASRDAELAGELLSARLVVYLTSGRAQQVLTWLSDLRRDQIAGSPALSMSAAYACLVKGKIPEATHWAAVAAASRDAGQSLGSAASVTTGTAAAGLEVLRAVIGRVSGREMQDAAARAIALDPAPSRWRSTALMVQGVGAHLCGDREQATGLLSDAADLAGADAPAIVALALTQRTMIAIEQADWPLAEELGDTLSGVIDDGRLRAHPLMAVALSACAAVRAHQGRVDEAKHDLRAALELLAFLGESVPWYGAQANILAAHAALWLADIVGARTLLAHASRLARRIPDAVIFERWFTDAWAHMDDLAENSLSGPSTLTIAELRVLRFLPSHRSFREIAEQLGVSANTVKSQAHAVYRKLGAGSRSEAVERASEAGLLGQ